MPLDFLLELRFSPRFPRFPHFHFSPLAISALASVNLEPRSESRNERGFSFLFFLSMRQTMVYSSTHTHEMSTHGKKHASRRLDFSGDPEHTYRSKIFNAFFLHLPVLPILLLPSPRNTAPFFPGHAFYPPSRLHFGVFGFLRLISCMYPYLYKKTNKFFPPFFSQKEKENPSWLIFQSLQTLQNPPGEFLLLRETKPHTSSNTN